MNKTHRPPTSSLPRADVLIIGTGPGGALAALLLAEAGSRVLLVDRRAFPRYKVCGACLNERALDVLRAAGLTDVIAKLPAVPLSSVRFQSAHRTLSLSLPGGLAIARDRLDSALVEAAVAAGAEFLPETTASVMPSLVEDSTRAVSLASGREPPREVSARVVLVADGLGQSSLQQLPEFAQHVAEGSRIGLGATVCRFPPSYESGTIFLAVQRQGYVGLVRTDESVLNVAAAVEADFVRSAGCPANAAALLLESAGCPAIPALREASWHGTVPLTRRPAAVAGHRILLLGDSTGYVEPFTGEGMAWALSAAATVVPFALAALEDWHPKLAVAWSEMCRHLIGRRQRWCRFLSGLVRRPWAVAPVMSLLSCFPSLARPLVEQISGTPRVAQASCP